MKIYAVAVSATDLPRARSFYELLGFRFPATAPDDPHLEAADDSGVRLMIDAAETITELYGEPPRPGTTAGFAMVVASPGAVDETVGRVRAAGHAVVKEPYDAPWGQRYATVADPDGYRVDVFCPLPG
ncbi:VOC family protein [Blastococcus xanthinilyticus]|uniref:Putative enzyme related to lactoylglutathione lyase n=1 Tax=Blastococcus xanthinilyticus TaxID=1564164 RepID=A0A5S5CSG2_9ACTN|nr:VOC family protein [Blastococcus xanthinilyticus]TYP86771.1 putative enzyme related to lactoylglutathione lyase [Blastococcus xanthinilyticus]